MVLDRLGITNAIVVGHSSGGLTSAALAEQRPDLVNALALINTGPRMECFIAQQFSFEPAQWPHLTEEQLRQAASTGFSRPGYRPPQEFIDEIRLMTFHAFSATMRASLEYLTEQPVPDRLKDLGRPLLVIFGEDDRRWRSSFAADYHLVPGAQVEMLPGLGHTPILEDPPRAAAPLLAFAGRHATQP